MISRKRPVESSSFSSGRIFSNSVTRASSWVKADSNSGLAIAGNRSARLQRDCVNGVGVGIYRSSHDTGAASQSGSPAGTDRHCIRIISPLSNAFIPLHLTGESYHRHEDYHHAEFSEKPEKSYKDRNQAFVPKIWAILVLKNRCGFADGPYDRCYLRIRSTAPYLMIDLIIIYSPHFMRLVFSPASIPQSGS